MFNVFLNKYIYEFYVILFLNIYMRNFLIFLRLFTLMHHFLFCTAALSHIALILYFQFFHFYIGKFISNQNTYFLTLY